MSLKLGFIANMPGLCVQNLACSLPILQLYNFSGYETCSTSPQSQE